MERVVDGLKAHYTMEGSGPPVLLLHGWGSNCDAFRLIRQRFQDRFTMVALDYPGFGGSEMLKEPWSVEDYARFTLHFIEELGLENPILIGHSHGGRVIIRMAGEGVVSPPKIVLLDAAGIKHKKKFKQKVRVACFKTIKRLLTLPGLKNRTQGLLQKARGHFGSADYRAAPELLRQTMVRLVNEDLTPFLKNIKAPTLLLWGEKDEDTPLEDAKLMEKLIPDAGLCVLKGAGHFSFVERPYEALAILESFLNG